MTYFTRAAMPRKKGFVTLTLGFHFWLKITQLESTFDGISCLASIWELEETCSNRQTDIHTNRQTGGEMDRETERNSE